MATHSDRPEDLSALEHRLSAWQPNSAGLDADAVLFAAGRASVRPGPARFAWPALTALLTALSVVLGLWLADERSERLALARSLRTTSPAPVVNPSSPPAANAAPPELSGPDELPPDSYLASRRALEKGLDAWPSRVIVRVGPPDPSSREPPILRLGQRDALLEP
ncbi:MAG TPA: hypothetical protein VMF69_26830 [Gemmataceae bacterium]|nr:hypothetical protein [Gemmataceae bacterium]